MPKLFVASPNEQFAFPLGERTVMIGRAIENDIQVSDVDVSRHHCRIEPIIGGGHRLRDTGSRNGSYVNGERISSINLSPGDKVRLGEVDEVLLIYLDDNADLDEVRRQSNLPTSGGWQQTSVYARVPGEVSTGRRDLAARLAKLSTTIQRIAAELELNRLMDTVLEEILEITGFERGQLLLCAEGSEELVPRAGRNLDARTSAVLEAYARSLVAKAVQEDRILFGDVGDKPAAQSDDVWKTGSWDLLGLECALCIPLRLRDADGSKAPLLGALYLDSTIAVERPEDPGLELLETVAAQVAIAIRNAQVHDQAANALDLLRAREAEMRRRVDESLGTSDIRGSHPGFVRALEQAERAAKSNTDITVLIRGETGTGKERIARAIHQASHRAEEPLVTLNCSALSDALLESELFGHEKGAFTGADKRRLGRFELADRGTIFLDEIGDVSGPMQAKLLRVLQEGEFQRVGGNATIKVDVRVVAATHRDLETLMQKGDFRADLFFRLNAFVIELPPLRERGDDVLLLAEHFVTRFAQAEGKLLEGLDDGVRAALRAHRFPGNVRELQSMIQSAVLCASGPRLTLMDLPRSLSQNLPEPPPSQPSAGDDTTRVPVIEIPSSWEDLKRARDEAADALERSFLIRALKVGKGNVSAAARSVGANRWTFHRLVQKHEIAPKDYAR